MYVCLYRHTTCVKSACNHRMVEAEEVGKSPCPTPAHIKQYPGTTLCFWVREAKHGYPIHVQRCHVTNSDNQLAYSLVVKCYSDIAKVEFSSFWEFSSQKDKLHQDKTSYFCQARDMCSKCLRTFSLALCVAFIPGLSEDRSLETFMKGPKGLFYLHFYIFLQVFDSYFKYLCFQIHWR